MMARPRSPTDRWVRRVVGLTESDALYAYRNDSLFYEPS